MSHIDTLKKLHTRIIDSRDGYKSSREQVEGTASYGTFFDRMIAQRQQFATRIRGQLEAEGEKMDDDGSILAAAHRTWLALRDKVTGDDAAVYAEIVNGETDLKSLYDEAIEATAGKPGWDFLAEQRADVAQAINTAEAERQRHAA
ncbi:hypothetical protein BV394_10465 [Brevirhabdus pacifica]|uniref:Uncharacterized protein n=1 Tax=Brevirhabdus pacifica TaxID=1267768 RepID=A0A1U7DJB5_9RHOB|nr:PA2169 family four-helix-bundle protein [Brevirhabdus pacifica]APX90090.1 hypothetical protein BV394_10465 [Brevirhabdus pacifica]OWU75320.1 hypothetical protein ATO5_11930 [Loktanella sp. 22II-4b]PJJ82657.1 uncharacterized protein (TIGR02284 family) [Brevirhabdus pacifica]